MRPQALFHANAARQQLFGLLKIFLLVLIPGLLTIVVASLTVPPVNADTDNFDEAFRGTGRYAYVAQGIGTRGDPNTGEWSGAGDIVLEIPDSATIVLAHLIWTGRSNIYDPDGLLVGVDGGPQTAVTAVVQHMQDPWCCGAQQRWEIGDVTNLIQPGTHVYNVRGHNHATSPTGDFLNYGVGIWVVYEDASEEVAEMVVFEGQDSFFRLWSPPRGPHTQVRCYDFAPSESDRVIEMTHFVSGIDRQVDVRSNAFWYLSGSGEKPGPDPEPGLIGLPGAVGYRPTGGYPFQSYSGLEWDNFTPVGGILINAGDTWVCFQVESGDSQDLAGLGNQGLMASGMWGMFAIRLPVQEPTAVTLTDFRVQSVWGKMVTLRWETAAEQDHFGFNLYRGETNDFAAAQQIHFTPAAEPGGATGGAVYIYQDSVPAAGSYWYWLESVDTNGERERSEAAEAAVSGVYSLHFPLIGRSQSIP